MDSRVTFYNENFHKDRTVKFRIKDIFSDHWESFLRSNPNFKPRDVELKEIDKLISCKTYQLGYSLLECPCCHEVKFVFHSCKSRFCPSCGNKYVKVRADNILGKCYNCNHRHIVFTISDYLWNFFLKDRKLINLLFQAVSTTLLSWFKDKSKDNLVPGVIAVLHTYGADMKWHPHIHTLVTEGAMGNVTVFKKMDFISYDSLRKRFQKILLDLLEKHFGKDKFRKLKNKIYLKSDKGFYVYAKKSENKGISTKDKISYIVRYSGKPAIAESRIINYDGQYVTFWYKRREDNKIVTEKIHAHDFIKRLVIHIQEENFKTVRYYGIYAKKHKFHDKMIMLIKPHLKSFLKHLKSWRMMILKDFHIDPIKCIKCDIYMVFQYRIC